MELRQSPRKKEDRTNFWKLKKLNSTTFQNFRMVLKETYNSEK